MWPSRELFRLANTNSFSPFSAFILNLYFDLQKKKVTYHINKSDAIVGH